MNKLLGVLYEYTGNNDFVEKELHCSLQNNIQLKNNRQISLDIT